MNNLYYKPSGKVNPISILYLLLAICIAVPILAFIYTYAILYIPLIYLNFLCVAGIAFGLGFVANFVIGLGKVRNVMIAAIFGLLVGIVGLYVSWIIWLAYHFEAEYMTFVTDVEGLKNAIGFANEQGTWGIGRSGGMVDGVMLSIVWAIEAIVMIGFPVFFAFSKAGEPFIENDDNWAEVTAIGPFELALNYTILKQQLEARKYEELLALQPAENAGQGSHTILSLYHGENRNQSKEFYLTITNMMEKLDKDGKLDFDEKVIINFINISKEAGQQLLTKIASDAAVVEN
ncbi:hypothetical protein [uncultured Kordia sp.]|uniref:hypothetical protein n=1 Tax=uncultured Kordia sp. TaxID=507699 RepID=UPI0026157C9F|nr:hypothetical protein [uncultured Kordia sp.]